MVWVSVLTLNCTSNCSSACSVAACFIRVPWLCLKLRITSRSALTLVFLLRIRLNSAGLCLLADAVTVYARTLLQTPDWFLQFCEVTGPQLAQLGAGQTSTSGEHLLLAFLDRWLDKFDAIGTPAARKLSALALCNVLTLPVASILDRLDPIAAHLTAVWFEVHCICVHAGCTFFQYYCCLPVDVYIFRCHCCICCSLSLHVCAKARKLA